VHVHYPPLFLLLALVFHSDLPLHHYLIAEPESGALWMSA
jgi:hypothetical protein